MTASLPILDPAVSPGRFANRVWLAVAFLVPLLMVYEFNFIGRMHLAELLMLLATPFLLVREAQKSGGLRLNRSIMASLILGGIWLLSQVATDLWRGSSFHDLARGWAKIVFFLGLFLGMHLFLGNKPEMMLAFASGLFLASPIKVFFYGNVDEFGFGTVWKFVFSATLTNLAALLFCLGRLRSRVLLATAVFLGLGFLHMLMGCRSASLIAFGAGALVLASWSLSLRGVRERLLEGAILTSLTAVTVGLLLLGAYQLAMKYSLGGFDLAARHEQQFTSKLGLLGGRSEFLYSLQAIADSPILGHGSWAKDARLAHADLSVFGLDDGGARAREGTENENLIPTHSHIFGAWVEAGVFGALFWMRLWVIAALCLLTSLPRPGQAWPLTASLGVGFLWDLLFSPFGFERRFVQAFVVIVILAAWSVSRQRRPVSRPITSNGARTLFGAGAASPACAGIHSITRRV